MATARNLAVITDPDEIDPSPAVSALEEAGYAVEVLGSREPSLIAAAAAEATALVVGYARVDSGLLDHLPRLRIVATMSVGVDTVDLRAAEERGVWVSNVPDAATEEVAVHALALALGLVRRITFLDRHVRSGGWGVDAAETMRRPSRLSLGVVGLGRIGRRFAALAGPAFGDVRGYDPFVAPSAWPAGVMACDLDELLARSDVVSLHLPGEAGAPPLLHRGRLSLLPEGAALVNVSRGSLVDTEALVSLLDAGRLSGAGLDVLPVEPPAADDPLRRHPRIVLTPHLAYLSEESAIDYPLKAAENVVAWSTGGEPRDVVVRGR